MWRRHYLTRTAIVRRMYRVQHELWLILYLSVSANRLDYYKMWRVGYVLERCTSIWLRANVLDNARCVRVREKTDHFLITSNL